MKTVHTIFLIVGAVVLSTSCHIFRKGKSRKTSLIEKAPAVSPPVQQDSIQVVNSSFTAYLGQVERFAEQNKYSTDYFFFIDMGICSGRNRFFVYDRRKDSVTLSGLVSHGSCNTHYLDQAKFSNIVNCGCSSLGRYKVGASYRGEFGKAYRLYGLDSTNSNAFKRGIVLHSFGPIPDKEIYPETLCNSFGCPMVSRNFLAKLSDIIDNSDKPILLWVYN
ncbi:MAG: hypothetical protein C5B59_20710 [Bacteroidetes bacterium]|nr:MAG: hypothetical protein C5B59_20710 [Bacteroidota bacterium]